MISTSFYWYQLHNSAGNPLHSIGIHCSMLHGFHCIQPGYIAPHCMQSTVFTRDAFHTAAWNPVHSSTLHGIQCIQSGSIVLRCNESTAFHRDPFGQAACNPLHSLWMNFAMLHRIQCIQSHCMESMHSIDINYTKLHGIHFIQSRYNAPLCIESTTFNHASWNPLHSIGIHWATLH